MSSLRPRVRHLVKKLLLDQADVPIVLQLLLQQRNREILKDSDVVVSDVLELYNLVDKMRRLGEFPATPIDQTKPIDMAAADYKTYLTKCNLFDAWTVVSEMEKQKEEEEGEVIGKGSCLLVVGMGDGAEKRLCEMLGGGVARLVEVEAGLDMSGLEEGVEAHVGVEIGEAKPLEDVMEEVGEREKEAQPGEAEVAVESYLRLLVNSRDELALARAITGPAHNLDQKYFTVIRQKTKETNMPMYQTIVSYTTQLDLGGKNAPTDDHIFFEFQDVLQDFVSLMEKLQTRVEETAVASQAVGKVVSGAVGWLAKVGVSGLDKVTPIMTRLGEEAKRRLTGGGSTPARSVGCGGSMAGRPAVKMLREVVDQLSHRGEVERGGHLAHKNTNASKTPNNKTSLINLFKTPGPVNDLEEDDDDDEFKIEAGLAERLGVDKDLTPVAAVPAYRRFQCASNWAMDSSPLLVRSAERKVKVRTEGRTLMASASPATPQEVVQDTRQILAEINEREIKDQEEENAVKKPKVTKRCLSKEVDAELRNKMGMVEKPTKKRKLDVENKEKPGKAAKKKDSKVKPLAKGQTTLASFFKK